jgi:anthranilate synthase component 1
MTCDPPLHRVLQHRGDHTHVALTTTLVVDGATTLGVFRRLADAPGGAFLLESVQGGELTGRYSLLGFGLHDHVRVDAGDATLVRGDQTDPLDGRDPLQPLQRALADRRVWQRPDLPRFSGGAVGYLSFDAMAAFEGVPLPPGPAPVPDAFFWLCDDVLVYDHLNHRLVCITHVPLAGDRAAAYAAGVERLAAIVARVTTPAAAPAPWAFDPQAHTTDAWVVTSDRSAEDYQAAVARAQEAIVAGEVFQVVVSQRTCVHAQVDPLELYRSLRALNPSPYMFFLRFPGFTVVGASPEVLVRLEGDELLVRPIAGTRRRGATAEEDRALAEDLLADPKELAEHHMLLDLGRNDVGRVAATGSVRVEDPLHVERYAHVMHLVSDVRGTLAPGRDAFDVLRACFPAGTVSGAPKIRACELLAELEPHRRGLYAGAVGYFDYAGNMDTCIAIRTMVVRADRVEIQAGAGIVYDSVPASEHEECVRKAMSALTAVRMTLDRARRAP